MHHCPRRVCASSAAPSPPCLGGFLGTWWLGSPTIGRTPHDNRYWYSPVYGSDLDTANDAATTLVIVQHGGGRNGFEYFASPRAFDSYA
jgi:hypothetical protein